MTDERGTPRDQLFDLTLPIDDRTLVYPGDPRPHIKRLSTIDDGAALTASTFDMHCHVGTHVDAPAHLLSDGRLLSDYAIEDFCGPAVVVDLAREPQVTAAALLAQSIPESRHVLLRTRNSALLHLAKYDHGHAAIEPEAAALLLDRQPLSIGFDYYSVDASENEDMDVHRLFAAAGLLVYVCLDLSLVPAGEYRFFGLPLRLSAVEAAPVRAVAVRYPHI